MSDHHDHDHPDFLGHHWENPKQQFEAGKLGMWLFLATEVLFFGGLFCAYAIWRGNHPELFKFGSEYLDTMWGAINTAVLIASSLTMAMAVTFAQQNKQGPLKICLALTLLGAFGFMGIKAIEYSHKWEMGIYPGMSFYQSESLEEARRDHFAHAHDGHVDDTITLPAAGEVMTTDDAGFALPEAEAPMIADAREAPRGIDMSALDDEDVDDEVSHIDDHAHDHGHHGPAHPVFRQDVSPKSVHMFFNIYYMMTGLHGIHVLIGIGLIGWLLINSMRGRYNSEYFTQVDLVGLYWHIVDLIWIFLFPMFYLI